MEQYVDFLKIVCNIQGVHNLLNLKLSTDDIRLHKIVNFYETHTKDVRICVND